MERIELRSKVVKLSTVDRSEVLSFMCEYMKDDNSFWEGIEKAIYSI